MHGIGLNGLKNQKMIIHGALKTQKLNLKYSKMGLIFIKKYVYERASFQIRPIKSSYNIRIH